MSPLSQREVQVLKLEALGLSTKQIAAELGISPSTVTWHRKQGLARQIAAIVPSREPTSRTTSTRSSTSASVERQLTMAGRKAVIPR